MGTGTGTETGDRDGQCQMDVSDQKDGQRRTDVSDRETDSVRQTCGTGTDNVRRTCRTGIRTASHGRVGQRDGQRRTDVSDRETDSVGRTCRTGTDNVRRTCQTERRTASDGCVGQRRVALDERCRYRDTETEETEEMETRLIFRIEYKRLHEEKKMTKHGRRPPYIHSSRNSHTSSYSYPHNSHMYSYSHMCS